MIEISRETDGRLAPDDTALTAIKVAVEAVLANQTTHDSRVRPTWRERRAGWRFSGRAWTGPAHERRDRPHR